MTTLHDILVKALALQTLPRQIAAKVTQMAHDAGFGGVEEHRDGHTILLRFHGGDAIYFDGVDWHQLRLG